MFTIINRIFIFIWYQYDIENCYHYNKKFYMVLPRMLKSLSLVLRYRYNIMMLEKVSYNDVTSISLRNRSILRCKSNKKSMSPQYRVPTGYVYICRYPRTKELQLHSWFQWTKILMLLTFDFCFEVVAFDFLFLI